MLHIVLIYLGINEKKIILFYNSIRLKTKMGMYERKKRLKFGKKNELIFFKEIKECAKSNGYNLIFKTHRNSNANIDFYVAKDNFNKRINLELKTRRLKNNDIVLFVNYSKLRYVKEFNIRYAYLIWKVKDTGEFYYVFLTPQLLDYLINKKTYNVFGQQTTIVDKHLATKTKNLVDIIDQVHNIFYNDDEDVYEEKYEEIISQLIVC